MLSFPFQLQLKNLIRQCVLFFLLFIFPVFSITAQQSKTANFIVVNNPSSLTVFNKYQQRLSSDQLKLFPAGIPLQILKDNDLLSDGYSKAIKVSFENNIYFIIKNDNLKSLSESISYKNVKLFSDTVEVTVSNKIFFNSRNQSESSDFLDKGTRLLRVFRDGQFYYARKLNSGNQFGWIPSNKNYLVKPLLQKTANSDKSGISNFLFSNAEKKITAINEKLEKLYSIYNQKESRNISVPNLTLETQDRKLICRFQNLTENNAFSATQKYIQNELEIVFLGSGYKISKTDFGFEIIK